VIFGFIQQHVIGVVSGGLVFKMERRRRTHSFRSQPKTKGGRRRSISSLKGRRGLLILNERLRSFRKKENGTIKWDRKSKRLVWKIRPNMRMPN